MYKQKKTDRKSRWTKIWRRYQGTFFILFPKAKYNQSHNWSDAVSWRRWDLLLDVKTDMYHLLSVISSVHKKYFD